MIKDVRKDCELVWASQFLQSVIFEDVHERIEFLGHLKTIFDSSPSQAAAKAKMK